MKREKSSYRWPLAADLGLGILFFIFSNGRWIIPVAAFLAPVFLLRASRRLKSPLALASLLLLFTAATRLMLFGIIPSLLGVMTYGLTLYYAVLSFLPYLADRFVARRTGFFNFASSLVFPAALVVVEYANAVALGDWWAVSFSQSGNLPLIQLLSLTGMWGVTFLVAWLPAVVNWAIDSGLQWPKIARGVSLAAGVYVAVLFFGGARLVFLAPQSPTIRVASFTYTEKDFLSAAGFDKSATEVATPSSATANASVRIRDKDQLAKLYFKMVFDKVRECAKSGAAIVFWAEGMLSIREDMVSEFVGLGARTAAAEGIYLLMPIYVETAGWPKNPGLNKAIMISPYGKIIWDYLKSHPVPGSTDVPGNKMIPYVDTPFGRVGAAICYDLNFPAMIRQAGRKRVDIMLDPSWDWRAIDPLHARMAEFRAVENGFSLVRQTGDGLSVAVDGLGRPLAAMDHFKTAGRTMIADVPRKGTRTFYSLIGDVFAWICLAGLVAAVIYGSVRKTVQTSLISFT